MQDNGRISKQISEGSSVRFAGKLNENISSPSEDSRKEEKVLDSSRRAAKKKKLQRLSDKSLSDRSDEYDREHIAKQKRKRRPFKAISPQSTTEMQNREDKNDEEASNQENNGFGQWFLNIFSNSCCAAKDPSSKKGKKKDGKPADDDKYDHKRAQQNADDSLNNGDSLSLHSSKLGRKRLTA